MNTIIFYHAILSHRIYQSFIKVMIVYVWHCFYLTAHKRMGL
jgi:hypothetical protein